jgi:hypothetical protein
VLKNSLGVLRRSSGRPADFGIIENSPFMMRPVCMDVERHTISYHPPLSSFVT